MDNRRFHILMNIWQAVLGIGTEMFLVLAFFAIGLLACLFWWGIGR